MAGADYYPAGMRDIVGVFTTIAGAQHAFVSARKEGADWGEIGEIHLAKIVPVFACYNRVWKPWHEYWENEQSL